MRKIYLCFAALALYFQAGAQTLNQSANWPNPDWTITGSYNTDPSAFESNPLTTANFAFDDDDAGTGHEDHIAAESPVIDLTAAHTAGENFISITVEYGYYYLADDVLRFEYWDADTSAWVPFGTNIPGNNTSIYDNFCTIPKTTLNSEAINISAFTANQLSGFKYRIFYDDKIDGPDYNYGFCFDSPTIFSSLTGPVANCDAALTSPADGSTDVSTSGILTWSAATGVVSGYKLSVGTTSGGTDVLNLFDVGNVLTYDIPGNLNGTTQYFVTITSYNTTSTATGCVEYSFTTLTPPPAPANDECANAEVLAVDADLTCPNPVAGTTIGATQSLPGCSGTANDDVWYSFVATQSSQTIMIANTDGATDIVTEVFDACGGTSIKCQDTPNSPIKLSGLTVGNTYVFRIYTYSSSETTTTSFTVCVGTPPPPPVNDDAAGAIELTLDLGTACGANAITGISNEDTTGSNETAPTCTDLYTPSVGNGDLWYKIVAPSSEFTLNATVDTVLTTVSGVLYSGTPGNLTQVGSLCGNTWPKAYTGLNAGETYYYRVWDSYNDQIGTFSICGYYLDCTNATATYSTTTDCSNDTFNVVVNVTNLGSATSVTLTDDQGSGSQSLSSAGQLTFGPYAFNTNVKITTANDQNNLCSITSNTINIVSCPPANDDCANAEVLTVDADLTCPNPVAGTTIGATQSLAGCSGTANDDVWYSFTATDVNQTIMIANTGGATDIVTQVFDGCGGNSIKCQDTPDSPISLTGLTVGNTYVFRIYTYTSTADTRTSFTVCVGTPPPPPPAPANDECVTAQVLTVGTDLTCSNSVAGTTISATQSLAGCSGTANDDVWYSFTATDPNQTIMIANTGGATDIVTQVFDGCGGNSIVCQDTPNSPIALTGLTVGNTYVFRIYTYTSTEDTRTSFTVCVGTPGPPPAAPANDDCSTATAISGFPFSESLDATSATNNSGFITACSSNGMNDGVWYTVVGNGGDITVDALSTGWDAQIGIYTGSCGAFTCVDTIDDEGSDATETLTIPASIDGTTYYINIGHYSGSTDNPEGPFTINVTSTVMGVGNNDLKNFKAYPNPVKDILNLSYTKDITNVAVFNLLGQQVITKTVNAAQGKIDMSNLSNGTYLVKVTADNQVKTIKVIKG